MAEPHDQPITRFQVDRVKADQCPRCNGALDTGWECNDCGYDARWIAQWIADDDFCGNA